MNGTEDQVTGELNNLRLAASNKQNDLFYKINPQKKGLAIIFHHEKINAQNLKALNWTKADCSNLKNMLEAHNFAVTVHEDLCCKELMAVIKETSKKKFWDFSCLLIIVLSRDQDSNMIYAEDKAYSISNLFDRFTPDRCATLAGKPKLYLFQAYQDESDFHVNYETDGCLETKMDSSVQTYRIPTHADFLIVHSRVSGYYSCQNGQRGNLFIQTLCEIARNWQDIDLLTMLTLVNKSIAVRSESKVHLTPSMRIPCITSTLTRSAKIFGVGNEKERLTVTSNYDCLFYKMNHLKRGLAIIFNHENFDNCHLKQRLATNDDCLKIENTLKQLHFTVIVKYDSTFKQFDDYIEEIVNYDFFDCDCLFVAVLSHGFAHGEKTIIYAKDRPYCISKVFDRFTSDHCPTLAGKPRIFLIQTCRGDNLDCGVDFVMHDCPVYETGDRTSVAAEYRSNACRLFCCFFSQFFPCQSAPVSKSLEWSTNFHLQLPEDFLIAYSTVPEYSSFRNTIEGSFFIKMFCEELSKHWRDEDLLSILTSVSRRVAFEFESDEPLNPSMHKKKQMPCIVSKLTGLVKFDAENKNDNEIN